MGSFRVFLGTAALAFGLVVPIASLATPALQEFDAIRAQQLQMRADAAGKVGRYRDLDSVTRTKLIEKQDYVLRSIEGKQSAADLTEQERLEVFNALEWIEATVNRAEDERLVCERRTSTGSTMKQRVCKTASQMREDRERAREQLDRSDIQMRRGG